MSKDHGLLKGVSDFFTEDTLKNIVAKDKNIDFAQIEIESWDFGEASAKGDSYLSVVNKVLVVSKAKNEVLNTKIIIKSLPKNIGRRKTFRSVEFFRNEIIFYSEIVPKFEGFLKSKHQTQLLRIPKCLAFKMDGENDFLVLQDVSQFGYGPVSRQNVLTYEQFKYIVEATARFHAISFAFKRERKLEFDRLAAQLSETFFSDYHWENWYKEFHTNTLLRIARDALSKEYPGSEVEKKFNSYAPGELYKKCIDICSRKTASSSVISQGDAWAPNFLVRQTSSGNFDALILDFQLARCASPVLDIVFFLYASSDEPFRKLYYDQILKDYYAELEKSTKLLGCNLNKLYPWEEFLKEVKEQSIYGLVFSLEAIPFSMMPEEEAFDLDIIKGDEPIKIGEIWKLKDIVIPENRRRHADMIAHGVRNGFI